RVPGLNRAGGARPTPTPQDSAAATAPLIARFRLPPSPRTAECSVTTGIRFQGALLAWRIRRLWGGKQPSGRFGSWEHERFPPAAFLSCSTPRLHGLC